MLSIELFIEGVKMSRETNRSRGQIMENFVARLFRQAGYEVTQSYRSRGAFDLTCVRGDEYLAVQVKTGKCATAPRVSIPYMMGIGLPMHAKRLYWYHCYRYDRHTVWEVTHHGLAITPNPLAHMLPPPMDKNSVNRQRRACALA